MKTEIFDYILSISADGRLLDRTETEQLNMIRTRLDNPSFEDAERSREERLKDEQERIRDIVVPALDRLCSSVIEASEGANILAKMGLGEVSQMDIEAAKAGREIVNMLTAIRTGHPLDPDKIEDGQFLLSE